MPMVLHLGVVVVKHDEIWEVEDIVPVAEGKFLNYRGGKHLRRQLEDPVRHVHDL